MVKKTTLYPVIKETTYYDSDSEYNIENGLAGKPEQVKGSLMEYVTHAEIMGDKVEWIENREFEETLTYAGYSRGASSATFLWKDSTGATYQMFMVDMNDLLSSKNIIKRQVTGTWTYCKRGQNFGIKLIKPEIRRVRQ